MAVDFYMVSGVDLNDGATTVFVWCRNPGQNDYVLLGSGYIVVDNGAIPPGVRAGQYCVTFPLPPGYFANTIVVTDDKHGGEFLPNVTVTPCNTSNKLQLGVITSSENVDATSKNVDATKPSLPH